MLGAGVLRYGWQCGQGRGRPGSWMLPQLLTPPGLAFLFCFLSFPSLPLASAVLLSQLIIQSSLLCRAP